MLFFNDFHFRIMAKIILKKRLLQWLNFPKWWIIFSEDEPAIKHFVLSLMSINYHVQFLMNSYTIEEKLLSYF